jgi:cytochrome c oxidase subunit 3
MEVGTAEITDNADDIKRRRPGLAGSSTPTNGGGGNGRNPGGGGDRPDSDQPEPDVFVPEKSRIFTGFLLLVVLMTFGGLAAAYVVIGTNNVAEWQPFALPIQVWISTALIIASSLTYHIGKKAIDRNDQPVAKMWLIATTVLGAAFISSQLLVWLELAARGMYVYGNPYAGFFYVLTAVHAVHVFGGIIALGAILLRTWTPTTNDIEILRRRTLGETVGWYWHFMGAIWVVLFILLGFWK